MLILQLNDDLAQPPNAACQWRGGPSCVALLHSNARLVRLRGNYCARVRDDYWLVG